jgi:hypothetical protein
MGQLCTSIKSARTGQALATLLREEGLDVRDFQSDEGPAAQISSEAVPVLGSLLRIRCVSTGEERIYSIGSGFTWLRPFIRDLREGHFAHAVHAAA